MRKLTGHRPLNDVHRINYAKMTMQELWGYYEKLYYDISVLTEEQRRMIGLLPENDTNRFLRGMDASIAIYHRHVVSDIPVFNKIWASFLN